MPTANTALNSSPFVLARSHASCCSVIWCPSNVHVGGRVERDEESPVSVHYRCPPLPSPKHYSPWAGHGAEWILDEDECSPPTHSRCTATASRPRHLPRAIFTPTDAPLSTCCCQLLLLVGWLDSQLALPKNTHSFHFSSSAVSNDVSGRGKNKRWRRWLLLPHLPSPMMLCLVLIFSPISPTAVLCVVLTENGRNVVIVKTDEKVRFFIPQFLSFSFAYSVAFFAALYLLIDIVFISLFLFFLIS